MLALVGSGEYLPTMEPVDRQLIARLDAAPSVVCLPTAAGQEVDRDQRESGSKVTRCWSSIETSEK